jgi:D-alanyl-D-alanine carboxypeptidase/D-alanyl-D-alanine-endopeptidase (penicillin-binding protein 4)
MKIIAVVFTFWISVTCIAQNTSGRLQSAFQQFQSDSQMRNGIASLYVIDASTGNVVFDKNGQIGLAPASTLKIITSISAYEILGKDFRYNTRFEIFKSNRTAMMFITPSGDPTLGSWRWNGTKEQNVVTRLVAGLKNQGIDTLVGFDIDGIRWENDPIHKHWMWEDVANYYGANALPLNWRENQFDVVLRSGAKIGDPVRIVRTNPALVDYDLVSYVTSGGKGTGDNAYIFFPIKNATGIIRGTIPVNEENFTISGSMPDASLQFTHTLLGELKKGGIEKSSSFTIMNWADSKLNKQNLKVIHTETSPPLDSIIYWFNKKSINLYGEALIKTIGSEKKQQGSTSAGLEVVKNFWKEKGIRVTELNITDGSGLSPVNRVTTSAQVNMLQYAAKQPWFKGFYNSLPEYNNMKMKSGTIRGVKAFCGYHTAKDGKQYIYSFIVNNYNGPASGIVSKMYKVLDVLK